MIPYQCTQVVSVSDSIIIGVLGAAFMFAAEKLEHVLRIDDPCAAFPIHAVGGAWGVVAVGLFGEVRGGNVFAEKIRLASY